MMAAILIDTQLLVLLVVGRASPAYIRKHKRLQHYKMSDFDLLELTIAQAEHVVVTPHTLTEASNLLRQIEEPERTNIMATFQGLITSSREQHVPAWVAAGRIEFMRLGLADAGILALDHEPMLLLTADTDLYLAASQAGRHVENFNFIREAHR